MNEVPRSVRVLESYSRWSRVQALLRGGFLAVLLGGVLFSRLAVAQILSPGPLAEGHANLEGDEKCESCHSAGRGISNAKCNGCHTEIAKSEARGTGLHGRKYKGQPCAKCHSDHHGRSFVMVRWEPKRFQHEDAGWPLRGDHASTACNGCHKTKSYIGLSPSCTSCHKDPHESRFGAQCLSCHDEADWNNLRLSQFDHDSSRYPLRGAHVKVECSACHRGSPPKYKGLEFSSCTSCHNDPHDGKLGPACESCHLESDWHQVTVGVRNHPWLSLANGHARTPCIKCHDRGTLRTPSRGRACAGCHKPVHEANFGKRCESCHEVILWLGLARSVGLNAHGKTVYPLRGKHLESPCAGCHKPSLPEAERYRQLEFDRCSRCHKDVHDARFAKRDDGECKACHSESGFRPSRFGVTLHHSTRFPLEGRHTAVACGKCHQHDPKRRERLDWSSKKLRCAECHENPHGDQFQAEMRRNGCATCHTPASWTLPRIDHSVWPLTGAHASTPCAACHTPTEQDRKAGAGPSYRLAPRACDGCHDDVHRGQFRLAEPKRACEFCHSTVEFKVPDFDHTRLTGYELLGKHKALKCDACHTHKPTPGGGKAALFRLGYRRCRDCHADPHAERKGTLASSSGGLP